MELVRDCLDKQLVDRHGRNMGRVESVVLQFKDGEQPKVMAIETGAVAGAKRVHPALARWIRSLSERLGVNENAPLRIPWSKVVSAGVEVIAGVEAEDTPVLAWEQWLRKKVISKIPGS